MSTAPNSGGRTRVVILFGGRSGEHSISCATAGGMLEQIDRERFDVIPVGITRQGRWVLAPDDAAAYRVRPGYLPMVADDGDEVLLPAEAGSRQWRIVRDGRIEPLGHVDVVFPALHGPYGEDGTLQGALDLLDLPYVGPGVLASAAGMDKQAMKVVLEAAGLPVAPYVVVTAADWAADRAGCLERLAGLGFPLFVKPCRAGSSLGITKVWAPEGLEQAISLAQKHDPTVLAEMALRGREIECGVLGGRDGGGPRTAPPAEIAVVGGHDFYDFDAKYRDEAAVELTCPADLPADVAAHIGELAARAFTALGAEGLSRVDFFYDAEAALDGGVAGLGPVVVNEINTMPGFTPFSMFPRMWAAAGIDYATLITDLIDQALARPTGLR